MANISSIHIAPVKGGSSLHLDRINTENQEHINQELTKNNENWTASDYENPSQYRAILEKNYHDIFKQRMQKKANPIREAVVNIKEDTSMEDIKKLCDRFKNEFGITAKKISIHRDEGHTKEPTHINYHCHIVFNWQYQEDFKLKNGIGKKGTNAKLNRLDMVKMQDITAETLQMERGKSSSKKHLDNIQYKVEQEQAKYAEMVAKLAKLAKDISKYEKIEKRAKSYKKMAQKLIDKFGKKALIKVITKIRAKNEETQTINAKLLKTNTSYLNSLKMIINAKPDTPLKTIQAHLKQEHKILTPIAQRKKEARLNRTQNRNQGISR